MPLVLLPTWRPDDRCRCSSKALQQQPVPGRCNLSRAPADATPTGVRQVHLAAVRIEASLGIYVRTGPIRSMHEEQRSELQRSFLHHRWRLLILVLVGLVMAELVAARLWDEFHRPVTPVSDLSPSRVLESREHPAADAVRASGIVERINGGQPWEVKTVRYTEDERWDHVGVEWSAPVASDGPWLADGVGWLGRDCANIRAWHTARWSNVRHLHLRVDGQDIMGVQPGTVDPPPADEMDNQARRDRIHWFGPSQFHNMGTNRTVYQGPLLLSVFVPGTCPRGDRH